MNHWQMIALAYSLTFIAMALEVVLLVRRRRGALRQARAWLDADKSPPAQAADVATAHAARPDGHAAPGAVP